MRHKNKKHKLNRPADQRKALVRSLLTSLFEHGSLKTTKAKSRALQQAAEKLIYKAKGRGADFNSIRDFSQILYTESASKKALEFMKSVENTGGITRITALGTRKGDNAPLVQVQLLGYTS